MVGIAYFPFFLVDFDADFLAVVFLAPAFDAALRAVFAAERFGRASSASSPSTGSSCEPRAPDSMSTTSDHRMWYVDTSAYGITCTSGRLRPLRKTFSFTPSVRMSTF